MFCLVYTYEGNAGGAACEFPYTFRGIQQYYCILTDSTKAWCATTSNYDRDKKWGYCTVYPEGELPQLFCP